MRACAAVLAAMCVGLLLAGCQQREGAGPIASRAVEAATRGFDHSAFDAILRAHVRDGAVNYAALKAEHSDELAGYVASLAEADPNGFTGADDELAFWLNAYNAFVIGGVLARYPEIEKVTDVGDFFKRARWKAAGGIYSLDQIENDIVRSKFEDPRIHFVLVCAAQSCPPLQAHAMDPTMLQEQLDRATREAVNDPKYVTIDPDGRVLRLTRIMSWYKQDFVEKDGSLEAFLQRYLDEPARNQLAQADFTIEFMEYDWALNDAGGSSTR